MSRAFTKEDDAGEDLPELPVPLGPNYVTPRGLELLKNAALELVARKKKAAAGDDVRPIDRDLRYLESRIGSAIVVPHGSGPEARFGAQVTIEDPAGRRQTFHIVGDDEARSSTDLLSWSAPLALAILGAKAGETVTWDGPDGAVRYKLLAVDYPDGKQ
jgi:transcription elongation GreA/GreB family factor